MRAAGIALLLLFASSPVFAATKGGVSLPEQDKLGDKPLVLNGLGIREATIFNVKVYVAGLYLEAKSSDGAAIIDSRGPKKLVMQFVRDVDKDDLVKAYREGFEKTAGKDAAAIEPKIKTLLGWMGDLKEGERMVMTEVPGKGIEVEVKGKPKGVIAGVDFARAFWAIFLGPEPPNAALKQGLLGKD